MSTFDTFFLPKKTIFKIHVFLPNNLDIKSHDFMFTPAIIKTWAPIHFQQCGWYLDCLFRKPPPFDIAFRDFIQSLLTSPAASFPCSESPSLPKVASSKNKTNTKGSRPRRSKQKAVKLVDEPMNKDIRATSSGLDVPHAELPDPISSHPLHALGPKRIHMAVVGQAKSIQFFPPAVKVMSSS